MATADEILQDRLNRIISVPDRFVKGVGALQGELFAELVEILSVLNTGSETELSVNTINAINELLEEYYARLRSGKYAGYVAWFTQQMDEQALLSNELFQKSFNYIVSERAKQVLEISKQTAVRELLGDDFKTNFVNVVRDVLTNQITGGTTFEGLIRGVRQLYFPETIDPQMLRWTKQVASDRFAITDRSYNLTIADDLDLQFFQYAGGLIPDSRPFCIERDGQIFHREEAAEWAALTWAGKFRNTTPQNILDVLGGYRCGHVPVFVSVSIVPPEVIERAIAKGYYKPSAGEKNLLNIL